MADILAQTNNKIFGSITSGITKAGVLRTVGWILFFLIVIGGVIVILVQQRNRKLYNKKVTMMELVGDFFQPALKDVAKIVKLGTGGFEILYLKKQKTWKIAYGGRVGMNQFYFFKSPDGYWYNSMFYGKIEAIDQHGGLIPVVTANPLMRGQYTALEKQIDALHADKKSFLEKYGQWIFALSFILIAGFLLSLCYKQFASAMGSLHETIKLENDIIFKLSNFAGNVQAIQTNGTGLIPVTGGG